MIYDDSSCVSCGIYINSGDMVCSECRRNPLNISKMNRKKNLGKKSKKSKKRSYIEY